ncbi:MAG: hydrogenase maturation protease [Myxococcales bacterium]|nr:hydrogenase maturation protease [Myxococcales bacterium]
MSAEQTHAVYGIGNILMGDDGIGPFVLEELQRRYEWPSNLRVEDLGTPGLDLVPHLSGLEGVILVDAVAARDHPPGSVLRYDRDEILRHPLSLRLSPHDPGLRETIQLLEFESGTAMTVVLVGIVAGSTEQGAPLSDVVRAAAPAAVERVLNELARWNIAPQRENASQAGGPWWVLTTRAAYRTVRSFSVPERKGRSELVTDPPHSGVRVSTDRGWHHGCKARACHGFVASVVRLLRDGG